MDFNWPSEWKIWSLKRFLGLRGRSAIVMIWSLYIYTWEDRRWLLIWTASMQGMSSGFAIHPASRYPCQLLDPLEISKLQNHLTVHDFWSTRYVDHGAEEFSQQLVPPNMVQSQAALATSNKAWGAFQADIFLACRWYSSLADGFSVGLPARSSFIHQRHRLVTAFKFLPLPLCVLLTEASDPWADGKCGTVGYEEYSETILSSKKPNLS